MQAFRSEGSDGRHLLGGESSSREASLRQQAGRAQSKSRRERQVMRLLMSETFFLFFSIQVSQVVRNLLSENPFFMRNLLSENLPLLVVRPFFLSFFCQCGIPGCLGKSHVSTP